jgi:predicted Zn-dependent protease
MAGVILSRFKRKVHATMNRSLAKIIAVAAATLPCTAIGPAQAQTRTLASLSPPQQILLYVRSEIKDADFVEPLVCALRQVLTADVNVKNIRLPLGQALLASPTQFDVSKVSDQFARASASDGGLLTYKYLLVPIDLKDQTHRYVFATSFPRDHNGVVSLARLYATNTAASRHERAELTALRIYKLILKSIARLAGYTNSNGCILAFPRNLDELDAKSSEFCRDDHALLVESGLLKDEESGGCAFISNIAPEPTKILVLGRK